MTPERKDRQRVLTIAISTIDESRLGDFDRRYPAGRGWIYLVLVQSLTGAPNTAAGPRPVELGRRDDVEFVYLAGLGVTKSRNAAIERTRSPLLLFCDDDLQMQVQGIERVIAAFEADPELALMTGRTLDGDGGPIKRYAPRAHRLTLFNSAKYGTVELAVRVDRVRDSRCAFDERFGAGSDYPVGDEFIFIADCIKRGLKSWYFPIDIALHLNESSGQDWTSASHLKARASALRRVFGPWLALPMSVALAVKNRRSFASVRSMLGFVRTSIAPNQD